MAYTPPSGDVANLDLGGLTPYTPPSGSVADLALRDPLVPVTYSQALSWRICTGGSVRFSWAILERVVYSQALSWRICTGGSVAASWQIFQGGSLETSWRIFAGGHQAVAWNINALPRIVRGHYRVTSAVYREAEGPRRVFQGFAWADPPNRRADRDVAWSEHDELRVEAGAAWSTPPNVKTDTALEWAAPSDRLRQKAESSWKQGTSHAAEVGIATGGSPQRFRTEADAPWTSPPRRRVLDDLRWGQHRRLRIERQEAYSDAARRRLEDLAVPWGKPHRVQWLERWGKEVRQFFSWRLDGLDPSQEVYRPPAGDTADVHLRGPLLDWPGYSVWLFLRLLPCPSPAAARRKAWFLMNSVSVIRLPDRHPVPALGLSLSSDYDSWAWSLSMTVPDRDTLALISPVSGTPWEVEITVNGYVWTAVIEGFEERRQFGKSGFTVNGRSRSAYLAAPFAPARNFIAAEARTAAQLAGEEVSEAGWEIDWTPPDWLLPAGAYAYQGRTPVEAVAALAGAVGGRLQTHRSEEILRVISRYPVSPWAWAEATPDKTLTDNLAKSLALRWQETPAFNGVYVSGQNQGVLVNVKRTGSDGTPTGQMIVDPLITHVDAGRERGRVYLAGTGRRAAVTLELPLLPSGIEPGLLESGQLVEVDDGVETWRGLVTGTSIDVGRPSVRQTVSLERFYL